MVNIANKYLTEMGESTNSSNNDTSTYKIATVNCEANSSVRIRSQATTSSSVVTTCKKGTTVTVMQENVAQANGYTWDKIVTSEGIEGYIANNYLDKGNGSSSSSTNNSSPVVNSNGDVNGNGQLDASDYVLVKNHIMGKSTLSESQKMVGDVNGNGQIDASDYVLIKKKIMD